MTYEIGGDGVTRAPLSEMMRGNPNIIHPGRTRLTCRRRRCDAACATWMFACVWTLLFAVARAQRWPVMHDVDLGRVTISNDDGDVYVESTGEDSEIVLKTQKVRVLGDVYYNDLNVGFSARLDAVDETLTNQIDNLDATQLELRGADAGLSSRIDALDDSKAELQRVDTEVAALIASLNATDAELKAIDTELSGQIDALDATDVEMKAKDTELSGWIATLNATDVEMKAKDTELSGWIATLNATDAALKTTDASLSMRIDELNATDAELKGVDDGLSSRIDALTNIYVNELNVTDKQLIVTDATLGSRVDALNATQYELRGNDTALGVRVSALEAAKNALEQVDVDVRQLIGSLNATDATMHATDDALNAMITALTPPMCQEPGGIKLVYNGTRWQCVCEAQWSGTSCASCAANYHVVSNACVACAPGSTNAAGDLATGADTECDITTCDANFHVVNNACVACAPGSTNAAGDEATGADTSCVSPYITKVGTTGSFYAHSDALGSTNYHSEGGLTNNGSSNLAPGGSYRNYYYLFSFTVGQNDAHTLEVTSATSGGSREDTVMLLYQGTFDPSNPTNNFLFGDDDDGENTYSKISTALYTGFTYNAVITGYNYGTLMDQVTLKCESSAGVACNFL